MAYKKIEPNVWKPEKEGDEIEGILVSVTPDTGKFKSTIYHVECGKEQKAVWGSTILDDRMKFVKEGDKIKIVFKGKGKNTKGQEINLYEVFKDEEDKNPITTW